MKFVGIDLTSAFAASPRPIDLAVLDDRLEARFFTVDWPGADATVGRDPGFLTRILAERVPLEPGERMVLAIDGPQGLATVGNAARTCERLLRTPGRSPSHLPPAEETGVPFAGFMRSSIDLFAGLVAAAVPFPLAGLDGVGNVGAGLWEVYPGAEWVVLAGGRLPGKNTVAGRAERRTLLQALDISYPTRAVPTADENDALVGAYLAWCVHHRSQAVETVGIAPVRIDGEIREGFILHLRDSGGIAPQAARNSALCGSAARTTR